MNLKSAEALVDCKDDSRFGAFVGVLRPVPAGNVKTQYLTYDYAFRDAKQKKTFVAPKSKETKHWIWNGSSIPIGTRWIFGQPKVGCHKYASVVHDYLYQRADDHNFHRVQCDRMYLNGVRAKGVSGWKAKTMYYAIRRTGWLFFQRSNTAPNKAPGGGMFDPRQFSEDELTRHWAAVAHWIDAKDPSLDEIDAIALDDPVLMQYAATMPW